MAQPKMKNLALSLTLALIALAKAGAEPVRTSRVSPVCELIDTNLISILSRDDSPALNAQLEKGLSPNKEYGGTGCMPEELSLPLLRYAITFKAESCVRLLLDRGASVTRPDAFNKIAIQWAEEEGTPRIADMVERANMDTNLVSGLEITNVIMRLFPPGSLVVPPADVPLVVVFDEGKDFGRELEAIAGAFPWTNNYSMLRITTNSPFPVFEYQMNSYGGEKNFGGGLSRHRGFYIITNSWSWDR